MGKIFHIVSPSIIVASQPTLLYFVRQCDIIILSEGINAVSARCI
jgi:hypothetical protein